MRYRYRTQIVGRNAEFAFASGGRSYRQMVRQLFPLIPQDKLDLRTIELRDYLCEPKPLNREVKSLQLASVAVLDDASLDFKLGGRKQGKSDGTELQSQISISNLRSQMWAQIWPASEALATSASASATASAIDCERAVLLGQVGNKLRIAGRLNEAREAFRRALIVTPTDSRLIFEFARLLRSRASSLRDAKLLSRARAALRLSARRARERADAVGTRR